MGDFTYQKQKSPLRGSKTKFWIFFLHTRIHNKVQNFHVWVAFRFLSKGQKPQQGGRTAPPPP